MSGLIRRVAPNSLAQAHSVWKSIRWDIESGGTSATTGAQVARQSLFMLMSGMEPLHRPGSDPCNMAEIADSAFVTDSIGIAWADVLTTKATATSNLAKR